MCSLYDTACIYRVMNELHLLQNIRVNPSETSVIIGHAHFF